MFDRDEDAREIRGLLLDFGGVISRSLFEEIEDAEKRIGLPPGTLNWRGPIDPSTDPLWRAMQNRELSEREYWAIRARETGALLGEEWSVQEFIRRMRSPDPNAAIRPQARRTIGSARRAGLRVGILTNELELFYGKEALNRMDILRDVHCIVDATHTGILKPDQRAFELGLQGLSTRASDTLFVDDQPRNVEGAVRAGLQALLFDMRDAEASFHRVSTCMARSQALSRAVNS